MGLVLMWAALVRSQLIIEFQRRDTGSISRSPTKVLRVSAGSSTDIVGPGLEGLVMGVLQRQVVGGRPTYVLCRKVHNGYLGWILMG